MMGFLKAHAARCLFHRSCGLQNVLVALLAMCSGLLLYIALRVSQQDEFQILRRAPPVVDYMCTTSSTIGLNFVHPTVSVQDEGVRTDAKILLLVETASSNFGKQIALTFTATRIAYTMETVGKSLPVLSSDLNRGQYAVIVFENFYRYINMDRFSREVLDKYCLQYKAGIIGFVPSRDSGVYRKAKVKGFPLFLSDNLRIQHLYLNTSSQMFYLTRAVPGTASNKTPAGTASTYTVFYAEHETYESVVFGTAYFKARDHADDEYEEKAASKGTIIEEEVSVIVRDQGILDGIQRVLFGQNFSNWLTRLVFLDAVAHLSQGRLVQPLVRYLQIDIDDIFVGQSGYRLTTPDVKELLASQLRFRDFVPGFHWNLGFSGKFYHGGNSDESAGEDFLLAHAKEFWWFPHMYRHNKAYRHNETMLNYFMNLNKEFAETNHIPVQWHYAVAPHHGGVYPVHEALYRAWKDVWAIQVTSTEEYPHLNPAANRRGFIHNDIMVLPRQTCGLYTHTVFLESYPGGRDALDGLIFGGDLFFTFVYNPFLIFMTHSTNFANDRLALYTFESVLRFLRCWTNLKFKSVQPLLLAEKYFRRFPEEKMPVWGNPCQDKRHLAIWSPLKNCARLPGALILGPQKTGTTALYTFLKLHPNVQSNVQHEQSFEELQFFSNRKNYKKGIDWYMSYFPEPPDTNETTDQQHSVQLVFEKSATYFDHEEVPKRVQALLPDAKLLVILASPAQRAYSWYQHMRAHEDPTAMKHTFYEVISAAEEASKELLALQARCLNPGMYAFYLERWLEKFPPHKILLIDGDKLKENPIETMQEVQEFLQLYPTVNFSELIKFDARKGFFCPVIFNRTKCLGKGKGRTYAPMDTNSRNYLVQFYKPHNVALQRLLGKLGYTQPDWLKEGVLATQVAAAAG